MAKAIDLAGQTFGRLRVLRAAEVSLYGGQRAFVCLCECGREKTISGASLRRGASKSCGCQTVHRGNSFAKTHGLARHRLTGTWRSMKERCYNPKHAAYARYGGRGISVCERWHSLENFIADNEALAAPGLTLDRRDNDGPYSPENCRWATRKDQARNRGNSRQLTFGGRTMCVNAWAEEVGMSPSTLLQRITLGWSTEAALTAPPTPRHLLRRVGRLKP